MYVDYGEIQDAGKEKRYKEAKEMLAALSFADRCAKVASIIENPLAHTDEYVQAATEEAVIILKGIK